MDGIKYNAAGEAVVFSGEDAVLLYRAAVTRSALSLLKAGIRPARGVTLTKALAVASEYTKKPYKRSEVDKARDDLAVWIREMKAALPQETL